ncbi:MAG: carbohydrate ABC transporter permease [Marvinbryantia sp.]|uniref:carbohydrate ABC transporter permease n=1 Tax=Marvinbryantia sp. TaxID=2496532 RepID=UPI0025E3406C|nr:carbohydrate ABC transporter permease [uncultured Marvinbryantia sp.]
MSKIESGLKKLGSLLVNVIISAFSLFCLFPVVWMLYSSLKEESEFKRNLLSLPTQLHFENYQTAVKTGRMDTAFVNSVLVSVTAVVVLLLIAFLAGTIFGRYVFKGKKLLYTMFLMGMLIPVHSLLVPVFIELKTFSLNNNRFVLALIYAAFGLPKAIFLMTTYASTIPRELEEAAIIDGGNTHDVFFRIFLPISKPILSTITILSFLDAWNEFPFSLVLMGKPELKTLPIALTYFTGQYSVDYTPMMAGLAIATLPVVIVYFIFHKKIMEGMVAGAVKG